MKTENWQKIKGLFHAAVDLDAAERPAFLAGACAGDDESRRRVEALLTSHEQAGLFLISPALVDAGIVPAAGRERASEDAAGQRIGSYAVIRELGRGGMGTVYLAARADDNYRQRVAIKLVNRGMDTEAILRLFFMERQILANLEHPNIARLLDGGATADGLPYFVMEYIEGRPINRYCDERRLTVPERLELFGEVCAAVQHAHQHLVVHRDIKPSNILVTAEGVPKLLDFGIAKLLTPGWATETADPTAGMLTRMTPDYASPEQLWGRHITTASDVYSLGVVLYELLCGHRPYRVTGGVPEEMARQVLQGEPLKPSAALTTAEGSRGTGTRGTTPAAPDSVGRTTGRLRRRLAGDLDNLVLKALRKEPQRRYASVHELAEDIRRHLEGLPVTASPDTFGYRARKFTLRHKAGVLAAAAVVITLLTATVITAWQAHVARAERVKAERRFNDVRKLANSLVFELHDSIQDLPGSTPSRELLVSRALEFLDKLAGEAGQEPSLQLELAAAYDRVGDIQGGFGTSHLGQRRKAGESYRKALAIREALAAEAPGDVGFRQQLATSYTKMGDILWIGVDIDGALASYGRALEIDEKLAAELPGDVAIRSDLAVAHRNVGNMRGAGDHAVEALKNTREAVVLFEGLSAADPGDTKLQYELALSYDKVAEILTGLTENHAEALSLMRKAQNIGERLAAADPLNAKLRRGQGVGHFNVAMVSTKLGDTRTGLESSRKALSIFTELSSADPQNDEFRQAVAIVQTFVCEMMIKNEDAAGAIKLLRRSLLSLEESFSASPTDEIAHFRIANVQADLGQGYAALASDAGTPARKRLSYWREARSWLQKGEGIYQGFRDAGKLTGEDETRLDAITGEIAKCDAAIARLAGKQNSAGAPINPPR
jgi:eukaryotic-like serine/threonine-protein kinase